MEIQIVEQPSINATNVIKAKGKFRGATINENIVVIYTDGKEDGT